MAELTIRSKAYWGYDDSFLADARPELEFQLSKFLPDFHVYVLETGGELLGFCSLIPLDRETIELHDLFVDPRYIGKGYGKRLWHYAVNLARDLGFNKLTLIADPNAEPFYAHQGAVHIQVRPSPVRPDRKLPVMEYLITA